MSEADFQNLKCIPADKFTLYNDPGENLANSIGLLFEQCGGKNSEELPELDPTTAATDSFADSIDAFATEVKESFQALESLQCSLSSSLGGELNLAQACSEQDAQDLKDPETAAYLAENWPRYNYQETIWCKNLPKQYMQRDWAKLIDGRMVSSD